MVGDRLGPDIGVVISTHCITSIASIQHNYNEGGITAFVSTCGVCSLLQFLRLLICIHVLGRDEERQNTSSFVDVPYVNIRDDAVLLADTGNRSPAD